MATPRPLEWPLHLMALLLTPPLFVLTLATRRLKRKRGVRVALSVSDSLSPVHVFSAMSCSLALARAGAEVVVARPGVGKDILGDVDGVLFSGGEDIHRDDDDASGRFNLVRDETEKTLLEEALRRDLPVLGICRGMQLLAVCRGGSLASHKNDPQKHHRHLPRILGSLLHEVEISEGTTLRKILGAPRLKILSIHGEHVVSSGDAVVAARDAEDGMIEAIELCESTFAIGVQWHPEIRSIPHLRGAKLVSAFVKIAATSSPPGDRKTKPH